MRMRLSLAMLLLLLAGCQKAPPPASTVDTAGATAAPLVTIIHVKNWHWLSLESFAADQGKWEPRLTDSEINARYAKFLDDVDALQLEQVQLLRELTRQHHVRGVFYEGVTDTNGGIFIDTIHALRRADIDSLRSDLHFANQLVEKVEAGTDAHKLAVFSRDEANAKLVAYRNDLLQVGAVGRLLMTEELDGVLALDNDKLLDAANPVKADGTIEFNPAADIAREDDMARRLLASTPIVIAVLGGEHDLADNLAKFSTTHEYLTRETPKYRQLTTRE